MQTLKVKHLVQHSVPVSFPKFIICSYPANTKKRWRSLYGPEPGEDWRRVNDRDCCASDQNAADDVYEIVAALADRSRQHRCVEEQRWKKDPRAAKEPRQQDC